LRDSLSFTDAWYVALARRLEATWITADQKAGRTASRFGVTVRIV
jgi:predicted nucleic acid-binding protein